MKPSPSKRFNDAFESTGLTVGELWLRYFALGGDAGQLEIDAYLNAAIALSPLQHDILAHAINERLDEIASVRAPYSADFHAEQCRTRSGETSSGGEPGEAGEATDNV
jgi:hypothetical protein